MDQVIRCYYCAKESVHLWIEKVLDINLPAELFSTLENGIILCYLIRYIEPKLMPNIQTHIPLSPSHVRENLELFIKAISQYGVAKHRLFSLENHLLGTSWPQLVECLQAFAILSHQRNPLIPELPKCDISTLIIPPLSQNERSILIDQLQKTSFIPVHLYKIPRITMIRLEYLKSEARFIHIEEIWIRIQARLRGVLARAFYRQRFLQQETRTNIVNELLETESSYIHSLKICIDFFLSPLRDGSWHKKLILNKDQLKTLFIDLELIYHFNIKLHENIHDRIKSWSPSQCLGNILFNIIGYLKVYSNYVSKCETSLSTYHTLLTTNKLFFEFIQSRLNQSLLDLPSYLIMPVQRVPRYHLLFDRLLQYTWPSHQDYPNLKKTVQGLADIAFYLNEKKRMFENVQAMIVLNEVISDITNYIANDQTFFGKYEMIIKNGVHCHAFLFSTMLIAIVQPGEKRKSVKLEKYKEYWNFSTQLSLEKVDQVVSGSSGERLILKQGQEVVIKFFHSSCNECFFKEFQHARDDYALNLEMLIAEQKEMNEMGEKKDKIIGRGVTLISPEIILKRREMIKNLGHLNKDGGLEDKSGMIGSQFETAMRCRIGSNDEAKLQRRIINDIEDESQNGKLKKSGSISFEDGEGSWMGENKAKSTSKSLHFQHYEDDPKLISLDRSKSNNSTITGLKKMVSLLKMKKNDKLQVSNLQDEIDSKPMTSRQKSASLNEYGGKGKGLLVENLTISIHDIDDISSSLNNVSLGESEDGKGVVEGKGPNKVKSSPRAGENSDLSLFNMEKTKHDQYHIDDSVDSGEYDGDEDKGHEEEEKIYLKKKKGGTLSCMHYWYYQMRKKRSGYISTGHRNEIGAENIHEDSKTAKKTGDGSYHRGDLNEKDHGILTKVESKLEKLVSPRKKRQQSVGFINLASPAWIKKKSSSLDLVSLKNE